MKRGVIFGMFPVVAEVCAQQELGRTVLAVLAIVTPLVGVAEALAPPLPLTRKRLKGGEGWYSEVVERAGIEDSRLGVHSNPHS